MPKKLKLESSYDNDFTLIGVVSHLRDYRLIWSINEKLHLHLIKMDDLKIIQDKKNKLTSFSLFYYNDPNTFKSYYCISNISDEGPLFIEHKQTNYFLLIKGKVNLDLRNEIIKNINAITNVLNVHQVQLSSIKNIDNFFSDIELHIMEINKKDKVQRGKQVLNNRTKLL
jgi:hypothetical protein